MVDSAGTGYDRKGKGFRAKNKLFYICLLEKTANDIQILTKSYEGHHNLKDFSKNLDKKLWKSRQTDFSV